ncbi:MAG: hypothetical protein IAE85_18195 [Anaerolinea sp.]|nr:hypothetical protein [Anaerolinea sp.]
MAARASLALAVAAGLLLALLASACGAPPPAAPARDVTFAVTLDEKPAPARDVTFMVMLDGKPAPGAAIYADGRPLPNALLGGSLTTGSDGRLTARLAGADAVVALAPAALFTTTRPAHGWLAAPLQPFAASGQPPGWKYQVFWHSLAWDESGAPVIAPLDASGTYTLTLSRQRPLILFNLLVSVEWDADQAYLDDLKLAMQRASTYLWDVTDGQMALGQVRIVDRREHWWEADIQVLANNSKVPHASIGGIEERLEPASYRIQLGPFWDARRINGPSSRWSESDGYRTIVHELGHYALGLYDEYRGSDGQKRACTVHQPDRSLESAGASVMNHQYTTSELSARDVPALWSPECEKTLQWQRAGQSAWQTVVQRFSRHGEWEILPPHEQPRSGPVSTTWPAALVSIPEAVVDNPDSKVERVAPFAVTVATPTGVAAASSVWLEDKTLGCALRLGQITAEQPQLWVLGAHEDDIIYVRQAVDESTWLCATRPISSTAAVADPLKLELEMKDSICLPTFAVCEYSASAGHAGAAPLLLLGQLAPSNPQLPSAMPWQAFAPPHPQLPSDVTWQTFAPLSLGMIPFNPDPSAVDARWHDAAFQDLLAASAVDALVNRSNQGEPLSGKPLVCFAAAGNCLPLDVGVTANALPHAPASPPAGQPARLTLASNDGLLQVFQQGSALPADLLIVDSPLPLDLSASQSGLMGVSRLYTLGGMWSNAELTMQIQADCCAGASERPPRLYRIEAGTPVLVEDSWYAEEEGYVLATIDQPGAYALFR